MIVSQRAPTTPYSWPIEYYGSILIANYKAISLRSHNIPSIPSDTSFENQPLLDHPSTNVLLSTRRCPLVLAANQAEKHPNNSSSSFFFAIEICMCLLRQQKEKEEISF
jgi:hypothetical protein